MLITMILDQFNFVYTFLILESYNFMPHLLNVAIGYILYLCMLCMYVYGFIKMFGKFHFISIIIFNTLKCINIIIYYQLLHNLRVGTYYK